MEAAEPSAPELGADAREAEGRGGFGSLGSIIYLLVLTWAAGIASFPLNDNSFFTHLATGRLILDEGTVPTTDPYTFTAQGEPWTVQSWLASVAYAGVERLAGDVGLRILVLAVFLTAMSVLWRLTRPAKSIMVRFLLMAAAIFIVTDLWSERPYMIGVIGLGLAWMALEGAVRPWLLVPFMWVWVNTHGSFPLALALVLLYIVGAAADRRAAGEPWAATSVERRVTGAVLVGTAFGVLGPIGPKILWFPLTAASKSDVFAEIVEWRAPAYRAAAELAFLVVVLLTMLVLQRAASWRLTLPALAFAAGGLYAQRNVVMATVVLLAAAARGAPRVGSLTASSRSALGRPVAAMLAVLLAAAGAMALLTPALPDSSLGGYPSNALGWIGVASPNGRLVSEISAGNLIEVLDGPSGDVFMDDRVDMFPEAVFDDYLVLRNGGGTWRQVLDRHDAGVVVWNRSEPLATVLIADEGWSVVFSDSRWLVAERRPRVER